MGMLKRWRAKFGKDKTATAEEDYERLGKLLVRAIRRDNIYVSHSWLHFILASLVRGLFMGLGSVLGATILVALAVWILNTFDWLPLIGEWFDSMQRSLQQSSALH